MKVKILTVLLILMSLYAGIATILMKHSSRKAIEKTKQIRKLMQINQQLESEVEMYIRKTNNI